jgi:hypothetical protein
VRYKNPSKFDRAGQESLRLRLVPPFVPLRDGSQTHYHYYYYYYYYYYLPFVSYYPHFMIYPLMERTLMKYSFFSFSFGLKKRETLTPSHYEFICRW